MWEDDVRIGLEETGWDGKDWIHLTKDRDHWRDFVKIVKHISVLQNGGNFLTG
jgi:hypothetical protein